MGYEIVSAKPELASQLFEVMSEVTEYWGHKKGIMEYDKKTFLSLFTSIGSDLELILVLKFDSEIVGFIFSQLANTFAFTPIIDIRAELYMPFIKEGHMHQSALLVNRLLSRLGSRGVRTADLFIHRDWGNSMEVAKACNFELVQEMNKESKVKLSHFDHDAFLKKYEGIRIAYSHDIRPAANRVAELLEIKYSQKIDHDTFLPELTHAANDAEHKLIIKFHEGTITGVMVFSEVDDLASIKRIFSEEAEVEESLFSYAMEHFRNEGYSEVMLYFDPSAEFRRKLRSEGIIFKVVSAFYSRKIDLDDI